MSFFNDIVGISNYSILLARGETRKDDRHPRESLKRFAEENGLIDEAWELISNDRFYGIEKPYYISGVVRLDENG